MLSPGRGRVGLQTHVPRMRKPHVTDWIISSRGPPPENAGRPANQRPSKQEEEEDDRVASLWMLLTLAEDFLDRLSLAEVVTLASALALLEAASWAVSVISSSFRSLQRENHAECLRLDRASEGGRCDASESETGEPRKQGMQEENLLLRCTPVGLGFSKYIAAIRAGEELLQGGNRRLVLAGEDPKLKLLFDEFLQAGNNRRGGERFPSQSQRLEHSSSKTLSFFFVIVIVI
ncbi:hypothetical protein MUK42_18168 [Musa troglodytarum]|uniref:Uncharacterized protein n=1 Tax=Musa troglodytarum TaxID=320322 RepID=A0A9E7KMJ5_9LILI|nr:hypothetical protein MUK42_18168 [Musa troglodytarum]